MNRVFIKTILGNVALSGEAGMLSGDEKRLMELIDGELSLEEIKIRVPLSVQRHLDGMFSRLLSVKYIEEKGGEAGDPGKTANEPCMADSSVSELARRVELEQEMAALRLELSAMRARMKKVDDSCNEVRMRVADYIRSMRVKLAEKIRADQDRYGMDASPAPELKLLDGLDSLNQLLLEQQQHIEKTMEIKALQAESQPRKNEPDAASRMRAHPHYGKLRGLDFFKSFGNAELLHFLDMVKWQKVKQGETVFHSGEVGMPFYIVVTGSVSVFHQKNLLASLASGEAFGEFSYLSGEFPFRSAQVKADTACELLVVDPLEIEFSTLQIRLHVAEALLRGQVRKILLSNQLVAGFSGALDAS